MIVAFIGSDSYWRKAYFAVKMWEAICTTISVDGPNIFLFNNANYFNNDCLTIVDQLKKRYRKIERWYFHGGCDYDVGYVRYMARRYDKVCFPMQRIVFPCYMRDRSMIDKCDVLITYCTSDELDADKQSLCALAIEYARANNKRLINIAGTNY